MRLSYLVLVASTLVAACATPDTAATIVTGTETAGPAVPIVYQVPYSVRNSTVVWSAEPGIDIFGREAQLVRAAVEAHQVALINSLEDSYPGYQRAVDRKTKDYYSMNKGSPRPEYGTAFHRIVRINSIENGFVAYTCMQLSNIASLQSDRLFYRSVSQPFLAATVTLTRAGSEPTEIETPVAAQNSPSSPTSPTGIPQWEAPSFDVFSGWNLRFEGPYDNNLAKVCHDWGRPLAPDAPSEGALRISSETPPETLPAYPGW